MPIPQFHKNLSERIFFVFVVLAFFQYVNNFFTTLLNIELLREEISFDTFEDLVNSNLTPYFDEAYIKRIFTYSTEFLDTIQTRITSVSNIDKCIDILMKSRNMYCVTHTIKAREFIERYRNSDGTPIMKMAEPTIFQETFVYFFEKSSPYVEKFDKIIKLIFESGIFAKLIT